MPTSTALQLLSIVILLQGKKNLVSIFTTKATIAIACTRTILMTNICSNMMMNLYHLRTTLENDVRITLATCPSINPSIIPAQQKTAEAVAAATTALTPMKPSTGNHSATRTVPYDSKSPSWPPLFKRPVDQ